MLADERGIVREEARYWWVLLVSGIAWVLIAWIVLRVNQTSITTVLLRPVQGHHADRAGVRGPSRGEEAETASAMA